MLGRLNTDIKETTVIGAGYAGLISAYRLLQNGYAVTIHEKSSHAGGLISSYKTEHGLVETAAHSIRSSPQILQLLSELSLPYVEAKSKKKFIYRDGKLRKNPLTLWEMFTAGSYAAFKKSEGGTPTLAEWAKAHIGPGALDNAMSPLAHGIYAASPEELDQQLAFPRMTIPEGQTFVDKIFKSKTPKEHSFVMAPKDGVGTLMSSLSDYVANHKNGNIIYNSELNALPDAANIILATPANVAGKLIGASLLENLVYAPMVTATVFVRKIPGLEGIGTLMARGEDQKILGILYNSASFENRAASSDITSLTIMLGGTGNPEILAASDQDIETIVVSELERILNLGTPPLSVHITRWQRAIPLYSASLREALTQAEQGWCAKPGHVLFGNYTGEVSIRGMCQTSLSFGLALAGN